MKLVTARPSPFAREVRVALHEKGIAFEEILDMPWYANSVFPAHNPLGKVPVLILQDGHSLYDSRVILDNLETLGRVPALCPGGPAERVAARQIEAGSAVLSIALGPETGSSART